MVDNDIRNECGMYMYPQHRIVFTLIFTIRTHSELKNGYRAHLHIIARIAQSSQLVKRGCQSKNYSGVKKTRFQLPILARSKDLLQLLPIIGKL